MSFTDKKLYELLPAIYRIRDTELASQMGGLLEDHEERELQILQATSNLSEEQKQRLQELLEKKQCWPLKALLSVIAEQAKVVEADMARLYENWFIETCKEWIVPYISDLLGVRGVHSIIDAAVFSQRAYVANTLSYRRRKGTAPVLEQLALDITGWRARAVEFFELLGAIQNVNHIRLHSLITPDLRLMNELELLDTAFDTIAHTVDVRRIATGLGRHNIPNIGLFLWRLQSYPITRSKAREASGAPAGRYTFSPLGYDSHLFNRPQTETKITHLADEINVPGLLRRRALYDELEVLRMALVNDKNLPDLKYFGEQPVIQIYFDGQKESLKPEEIIICNLGKWGTAGWQPPKSKIFTKPNGEKFSTKIAVDPKLGRLAVLKDIMLPTELQVSYAYGFSGDVGGGPYNRRASVDPVLSGKVDWQVGVSKKAALVSPVSGEIFAMIADAVKEWNLKSASPDVKVGVIALMDSYTYYENNIPTIQIPEGKQLVIVAADWPEKDAPGGLSDEKQRKKGDLTPNELRPHILGDLKVEGTAASESLIGGELVLDGLLVEGKLSVLAGNLGSLRVSHCTLVPVHGGLEVTSQNDRLKIHLTRSICGPVKLTAAVSKLLVEECIVDNGNGVAITANLTPVELQKSTIFGSIEAITSEAGNCIFKGLVTIERRQTGCIRFSYVPVDSKTPRRFRCQPDLEIKTQISEAEEQNNLSPSERDAIRDRILEWLFPYFTSTEYGHHAYGQLSRTCPLLIETGADDGSEMGVFNYLKQPQRETNLRTALDQYLGLGLEAGIIYVT